MPLKPLANIRILDFTIMPPGAVAAVMLADLGAEVIRVESPSLKGKQSTVFGAVAMSRAKKSITLDMRNPRSSELLLKMAPSIDVVIENNKPGSMEARGFGWSQANAANPGLIWCAISGFGQDGPYVDHAGHDISYVAHSGLLEAISTDLDFFPGLALAVPLAGISSVIAIQAAIIERNKAGKGAFLDISLSESSNWLLTNGFGPLSDKPVLVPSGHERAIYTCGDGRRVAVASAEPRTWEALCEGLNLPELKDKLRDKEASAETKATLAKVFLAKPAQDWVDLLANNGAAVTIVNHGSQLLSDPQYKARKGFVEVDGTPVPASPIRIRSAAGETTATNTTPASMVGGDNETVLAACGLSADEIADYAGAGVI